MGTEKATTTTVSSGKAPALYHVRARQRTSKVLGLDSPSCPSTPPLRSRIITVPFHWEDAPGKPKLREATASALTFFPSSATASPLPADDGATARAGGDREGGALARPAPLKLPPRLQAAARPDYSSSSPKTVLQGPYVRGGAEKPPRPVRRSGSTLSYRLMRGAGGGAFSWRKATAASVPACGKKDGHDHDASCCSPAASSSASSSSSLSSSSISYFFDVRSRGSGHWQQADGREDPDDGDVGGDGAKGSVRITRFRRNRSLPNISTSHLWNTSCRARRDFLEHVGVAFTDHR